RASRKRAVRVEGGVVADLPALDRQPLGRLAVVFNEAVAVAIAESVDPCEGCLDVRPQAADGGEVVRAVQIGAGEQDEERRRVDAAIISPERNLAEFGHLAEDRKSTRLN